MSEHQADMFGSFDQQCLVEPEKLARRTDPQTSKDGAMSIASSLSKTQQHVVNVAKQRFDGKSFTANQIAQYCTLDGQKVVETYRKRVREIEAAKVFTECGTGKCPVTGKQATLYRVV